MGPVVGRRNSNTPRAQKNEMISAGRTVRRNSNPPPMATCMAGEEGAPRRDVGTDEVTDVGDDPADDRGLALCVVQEVGRGEATPEHERLEPQSGIEQPEQTKDDLKGALGPEETERPAGRGHRQRRCVRPSPSSHRVPPSNPLGPLVSEGPYGRGGRRNGACDVPPRHWCTLRSGWPSCTSRSWRAGLRAQDQRCSPCMPLCCRTRSPYRHQNGDLLLRP